jgi:hypothetical protein
MRMMNVLGVDLATRRWGDIGIALLETTGPQIQVRFVRLAEQGYTGVPDGEQLVQYLAHLARQAQVDVVALDGPQAWKAPDNGQVHARIAEHLLHTQTKTGLPGMAKPGTALRFVHFSIQCFDLFAQQGWSRLHGPDAQPIGGQLAVEVYPTAVWRALGITPLPAKSKCSATDVACWLRDLQAIYPLALIQTPTHDEVQALVAGLVGLAVASGNPQAYRCYGAAPFLLDGTWREGYLANLMDFVVMMTLEQPKVVELV